MYPPKRDAPTNRPKLSYAPGRVSPSSQLALSPSASNPSKDLTRINRILDNAKNYQKDKQKQVKKDYMMEGLANLNKQTSNKNIGSGKSANTTPYEQPRSKNQQHDKPVNSQSGIYSESSSNNDDFSSRPSGIYTQIHNEDQNQSRSKEKKNRNYQNQIARLKNDLVTQSKLSLNTDKVSRDNKNSSNQHLKFGTVHKDTTEMPNSSRSQYSKQSTVGIKNAQQYKIESKLKTDIVKSDKIDKPNNTIKQEQSRNFIHQNHDNKSIHKQQSSKIQPRIAEERSFIDPMMLANRQNQNTVASLKSMVEQVQQQLFQMRNKFFKSEQKRLFYEQRNSLFQKQSSNLRKMTETSKIAVANMQAKLLQKQKHTKSLLQRIKSLEQQKNSNFTDIQNKMHYSNQQLVDKVNEVRYLGNKVNNYEIKLKESQYQINRLNDINAKNQGVVSSVREQYETHIAQLQLQIHTMIEQRTKNTDYSQLQAQNLRMKEELKRTVKLQAELTVLRNKNKQLQNRFEQFQKQIRQKDVLIGHLKNRSNASMDDLRIETLQQQLAKYQTDNKNLVDNYEDAILNQDRMIQQLTEQLQQSQKKRVNVEYPRQSQQQQFQSIMHRQSEQMNGLRSKISDLTYENMRVISQLQKMRAEVRNVENSKKMIASELAHVHRNNSSMNEANSKVVQNEVSVMKMRLESMTQQLAFRKKQVADKDSFIQNHILGLTKSEHVNNVLQQLQRIMNK